MAVAYFGGLLWQWVILCLDYSGSTLLYFGLGGVVIVFCTLFIFSSSIQVAAIRQELGTFSFLLLCSIREIWHTSSAAHLFWEDSGFSKHPVLSCPAL